MMNYTDGWMGGGMWIWTVIGNDRFAADLRARLQQAFGTAERERFLAAKRVVAQTERHLDAAARTGKARQEAR